MDADDTLIVMRETLTTTQLPSPPQEGKWGERIDASRRTYLEKFEQRSHDVGSGPYAIPGVALTGADVFWLAACTLVEREKITPDEAMARLGQAANNSLLRVSLNLSHLDLRGANLAGAHLEGAILGHAQLQGAILGVAYLHGAYLGDALLDGAFLDRADLSEANLCGASLKQVSLRRATLTNAYIESATLHDAFLSEAQMDSARLINSQLIRVDLREANLRHANFIKAELEDVYMYEAHLEGALFTNAILIRCDFRRATLDSETRLNNAVLYAPWFEQTNLKETNLAVVEWRLSKERLAELRKIAPNSIPKHGKGDAERLGDEIEASEPQKRTYSYRGGSYVYTPRNQAAGGAEPVTVKVKAGLRVREFERKRKNARRRAADYRSAARAYRALSVALNDQGISRDAARFQYRSEVMRRKMAFHEGKIAQWAVLWTLDLLAGYGIHKIWKLFISYAVIILGFATLYYVFGLMWGPTQTIPNALLLSFTSFHGRGLAPNTSLSDPMRYCAIGEALLGVVVEALLIAALVRLITGD